MEHPPLCPAPFDIFVLDCVYFCVVGSRDFGIGDSGSSYYIGFMFLAVKFFSDFFLIIENFIPVHDDM